MVWCGCEVVGCGWVGGVDGVGWKDGEVTEGSGM